MFLKEIGLKEPIGFLHKEVVPYINLSESVFFLDFSKNFYIFKDFLDSLKAFKSHLLASRNPEEEINFINLEKFFKDWETRVYTHIGELHYPYFIVKFYGNNFEMEIEFIIGRTQLLNFETDELEYFFSIQIIPLSFNYSNQVQGIEIDLKLTLTRNYSNQIFLALFYALARESHKDKQILTEIKNLKFTKLYAREKEGVSFLNKIENALKIDEETQFILLLKEEEVYF
jgi:hypothetical protein